MAGVAGDAVEVGPHFEHAAGFDVEDVVQLLAGELARPAMEPGGPLDEDVERLLVAGQGVHLVQAHQRLVQRVVGRPDALAARDPVQIGRGDRAGPFAAVLLLAARQLGDDCVALGLGLAVAGGGVEAGGGREPVAEEVAAQLAGGNLPAAVAVVHAGAVAWPPQAGLHVVVLQQVVVAQVQHVAAVQVVAVQERAGQQLDLAGVKRAKDFLHRSGSPVSFRIGAAHEDAVFAADGALVGKGEQDDSLLLGSAAGRRWPRAGQRSGRGLG